MKRLLLIILTCICACANITAQTQQGTCGKNLTWTFDGYNLDINIAKPTILVNTFDDYDTTSNPAPWRKKHLPIRRVRIGANVSRIGSCAFYACDQLTEVIFDDNSLQEIAWGAFLDCTNLTTINLPAYLNVIEAIAFARCQSLVSITIPQQCRVEKQAFSTCTRLADIDIHPTALLGQRVFEIETQQNGKTQRQLFQGEARRLPAYVTERTAYQYGIAKETVAQLNNTQTQTKDYNTPTSAIDILSTQNTYQRRDDIYAIIIGNEDYRFASNVPYAIHDARTFAEYCEKLIGIPRGNIHIAENATKAMILDEELDWAANIPNRQNKRLIIYYAGHGVPDTQNNTAKAYLLPTDIRGTHPQKAIPLEQFYNQIAALGYQQTNIFLDACFSGLNRDNEGVSEGLRAAEITCDETQVNNGNLIIFAATQGNETAQSFDQQGHGLFTFCLLNTLRSKATANFGTIFDEVQNAVTNKAPQLRLRKPQTPSITSSTTLADTWRNLTF